MRKIWTSIEITCDYHHTPGSHEGSPAKNKLNRKNSFCDICAPKHEGWDTSDEPLVPKCSHWESRCCEHTVTINLYFPACGAWGISASTLYNWDKEGITAKKLFWFFLLQKYPTFQPLTSHHPSISWVSTNISSYRWNNTHGLV